MKTIAITIDERTLQMLNRIVSQHRKGRRGAGNRSEIVREALSEYLTRRDRAEREESEWKIWSCHLEQINEEAAALIGEQAEP